MRYTVPRRPILYRRLRWEAALDHQAWATAAEAVMLLAWPLADDGQSARAARLLGAALGFYERAGIEWKLASKVCLDSTRQILGDQLDTAALQVLLHEGRTVPLDVAVRDALNESPRQLAGAGHERTSNP
jgi:hypothetical protein